MGGNDGCAQGMRRYSRATFLGWLTAGLNRFAGNRHAPGPYQFLDSQRLQQIDDGFDLLRISCHFDGIRRGRRVDDIGPKNIRDPNASARSSGLRMDLDQRRLPRNEFTLIQIHDFDDVDKLVELFHDLFHDSLVSRRDNSHLRHGRIERRRNRETFDIEPATAK